MRSDFDKRVLGGGGVWYGSDLIVLVFLYVEGITDDLKNLHVSIFSGGRVFVDDKDLMVHQEVSECLRKDGQELWYVCFPDVLEKCRDNRFDSSFQILGDGFSSRIYPIAVP